MNTPRRFVILAFATLALTGGNAVAQDLAKIVTKADVEKATGAKFKDGWKPMPTQMSFAQEGGDLQVSVDVEPREASTTVRGWEATIKKMQPGTKVDTVAGVGKDAIYLQHARGQRRAFGRLRQARACSCGSRSRAPGVAGAGEADRRRTGEDRRRAIGK